MRNVITPSRQDPEFGNPYNDIGAYLIEKGEFDEAITWFQKAIQARRYESPAFPHFNLGRVYERKGKWTEAIESYKKALALNPNYALAKKALGRLISSLNLAPMDTAQNTVLVAVTDIFFYTKVRERLLPQGYRAGEGPRLNAARHRRQGGFHASHPPSF